jgi:hypothetical protein
MNKLIRLLQIAFVVCLVVGCSLLAAGLGGSRSNAFQATPTFEPPPPDTPTPQPGFVMLPDQGMPGQTIEIEGFGWAAHARVELTWDQEELPSTPRNLSTDGDGHFLGTFDVPGGALQGTHTVRVTVEGAWAEEPFYVGATPTPTDTPVVPTNTPTATQPTLTPTAAPTFRQVTPIVSATATRWSPPPSTPRPQPTRTPTRPPTLVPTGTPVPSPSATPTPTQTPTATATSTTAPLASGTAISAATSTSTPVPTWTPASTQTPEPTGEPEDVTPTPTPTPSGGLSQTGIGLGLLVAAAVLGATVFVVRILRTRGLPRES